MRSYDCPQCGVAVPFQSAVTIFATCEYCRSMVVRRDVDVTLLGSQAVLPPDISPIKIGTCGFFDQQEFQVLGRVRVGYDQGTWNEWFAQFSDGRWGWIGEAQGFYTAGFEVACGSDQPGAVQVRGRSGRNLTPLGMTAYDFSEIRRLLKPGKPVEVNGDEFSVRDVKQVRCLGSEGELTFAASPGRETVSVDLGGPTGRFANLEYAEDGVRLYLGKYCRFEDLHLTNLRPLPGWTTGLSDPESGQTDALSCPGCGAVVTLRAVGWSMSAVCGSCGAVVDTSNPQLQILQEARKRQTETPIIPLGARGSFAGAEFECIGFLRRKDNYEDRWSEYLLFNPFGGFRWLVNYNGHWSLVEAALQDPREDGTQRLWDGRPYKLFGRGTAEVTFVLGEFYWKVRVGERTEVADYVHPPFILSEEKYPDLSEITWSHGKYIPVEMMESAFRVKEPLPPVDGVYLNQPNPHRDEGRRLRWLAPLAAACLLVIQLCAAARSSSERVFNNSFLFVAGQTNQLQLTPPIVVKGGAQALAVRAVAPLNNNWIELDLDLINVTNERTRTITMPLEFYHGSDWSEGSSERTVLVPGVAPGQYQLAVELTAAEPGIRSIPVQLSVTRDVVVWSNFWLGLGALLIYPAYRWQRELSFEVSRWSQSDLPPFGTSSENDD